MPELPEVETLKLGLQKYVVGKTIVSVEVLDPKLVFGDAQVAVGSTITNIRRLAKGIIIDLDNEYSVAFHIKLTGQLIYRDDSTKDLMVMKPTPSVVPNKFTRVVFTLQTKYQRSKIKTTTQNLKVNNNEAMKQFNNGVLYFQEVRGFAWMKVVKTSELMEIPFFKSLGPEPLVSQTSSAQVDLTLERFEKIVQQSNLPIKALLMDQTKIGGIGNIYANDSCFAAHIDPRRRAKTLSPDEIKILYDSLLSVLEKAMKFRGSSELNFVDVLGQLGKYQKHFLVYGRTGKECTRGDEGKVMRVEIAGRGTFFCTLCQK